MGIIVGENELDAPDGLVVRNFLDPAVERFVNKTRVPPDVSEVVVHETVTRSWEATVRVLKQKGLGVHFIVDSDGVTFQHADLQKDLMWHASQHNGASVGIETVNPYQPEFMPKEGPWSDVLSAPWAAGGKYVVPTADQAEAVHILVNWLTSAGSRLTIPQLWPGLQHGRSMSMGRVAADVVLHPGIHAHTYFGHADGAWLVLYSWLRMEAGLDPESAYQQAKVRATGAHSAVPLDDYFTTNPFLQS